MKMVLELAFKKLFFNYEAHIANETIIFGDV
jgi:hypothetical protein